MLTLVYQPFAVGTAMVLAHRGARINTRGRNLAGYTLFFLSSLALILVSRQRHLPKLSCRSAIRRLWPAPCSLN